MKKYKGFSLIEILLVIALMSMIAAFTSPFAVNQIVGNSVHACKRISISALRDAYSYAHNKRGDSNWGVYFNGVDVIIFKGDNYAVRDPEYDELLTCSADVSLGGISEVVFSRGEGIPDQHGVVNFFGKTGESEILIISSNGMIE